MNALVKAPEIHDRRSPLEPLSVALAHAKYETHSIPGWMEESDWLRAQKTMPIACVDVLAMEVRDGALERVGLIRRFTPHQGERWCLIGGRLGRNESFREAIVRQVHDALGGAIRYELPNDPQPTFVAQYFTQSQPGTLFDPRQHAIGMVFGVPIEGDVCAQGEALSFRWFEPSSLPPPHDFGFQQDIVVAECLRRLQPQRA